MAGIKTPTTERVLQRLVYEGVLLHNRIEGRRRKILLREVMAAAKEEPRILEILPALLQLRPQIIRDASYAIGDYPALQLLLDTWETEKAPATWRGIPVERLQLQAKRLYQLWQHRHKQMKWRSMNIRLADEDLRRLDQLAEQLGHRNKSAVIRELIAQAWLNHAHSM